MEIRKFGWSKNDERNSDSLQNPRQMLILPTPAHYCTLNLRKRAECFHTTAMISVLYAGHYDDTETSLELQ